MVFIDLEGANSGNIETPLTVEITLQRTSSNTFTRKYDLIIDVEGLQPCKKASFSETDTSSTLRKMEIDFETITSDE